MKCPNCKAKCQDNQKYCIKCGTPLDRQPSQGAEKKRRSRNKMMLPIGIGAACVLLVIGVGVFLGANQIKASHLQKKLDLGNKYLEEMDYEQAKAAFHDAVDIEPSSPDAYVGLSRAYRGMEDEEGAKAVVTIAMERMEELPEKERSEKGEILYVEAETLYAELGDTEGAKELEHWADKNKIDVKPAGKEESSDSKVPDDTNDKTGNEDKEGEKDIPAKETDPHQVYMDYAANTLSKSSSLAKIDGASAEYPQIEMLGNVTQEDITAALNGYKKTVGDMDGILGIGFADVDGDTQDEMLVMYTAQADNEEKTEYLNVDFYKQSGNNVNKVEGDAIRIPCRNTFPSIGNTENVQCFLKTQNDKVYLCLMNHSYGSFGTDGTCQSITRFVIAGVENGKVSVELDVKEVLGRRLEDILGYTSGNRNDYMIPTGKLLTKEAAPDPEGTKKILYEKLGEYGFSSTWMDSYFMMLAQKNQEYIENNEQNLNDLKSQNPFADKISTKEKGITDLLSVKTEVTKESEANHGYFVVEFAVDDNTKLLDNKAKFGFEKAVQAQNKEQKTSLKQQYQEETAQIQAQEDELRSQLETEAMSNAEMGQKCGEIFQLWDNELNKVYQEVMSHLGEQDQETLRSEERDWVASKDAKEQELRDYYQGGTILVTAIPSTMADMTKSRVYELIDLLPE